MLMLPYTPEIIENFWSRVHKMPRPDACWLWKGGLQKGGYGQLTLRSPMEPGQRTVLAHRFAWEVTYGEIPDGLLVLHTPPCLNRHCVRHLYLGDHWHNSSDMLAMGRGNYEKSQGENNNTSIYPKELIELVRKRYAEGMELQKIADLYEVKYSSVVRIVYRKNWKYLDSPEPIVAARHTPYTLEQVIALREGYAKGEGTIAELATRLGFKYAAAWQIVKRGTWKHTPSPEPQPRIMSPPVIQEPLPLARIAGALSSETPVPAATAYVHIPGTEYPEEIVTAMLADYAAGMTVPAAAKKHGMNPRYAKRLVYSKGRARIDSPVDHSIDRRSNITDDQVRALRTAYDAGVPCKALAETYGLRYVTVFAIVTRRNRKDVV